MNQVTLHSGEQKRIYKAIAQKIYDLEQNPDRRSQLFKSLFTDLKERFRVDSYKNIKQSDMQAALRYIDTWKPRKVS
jgi:hypothetical protein